MIAVHMQLRLAPRNEDQFADGRTARGGIHLPLCRPDPAIVASQPGSLAGDEKPTQRSAAGDAARAGLRTSPMMARTRRSSSWVMSRRNGIDARPEQRHLLVPVHDRAGDVMRSGCSKETHVDGMTPRRPRHCGCRLQSDWRDVRQLPAHELRCAAPPHAAKLLLLRKERSIQVLRQRKPQIQVGNERVARQWQHWDERSTTPAERELDGPQVTEGDTGDRMREPKTPAQAMSQNTEPATVDTHHSPCNPW